MSVPRPRSWRRPLAIALGGVLTGAVAVGGTPTTHGALTGSIANRTNSAASAVFGPTDTTPPTNDLSLQDVSGGVVKNGDTIYYRGAAAGSFRLRNALSDPGGSGPASSTTGNLVGETSGWSHSPSTVTTPAGGPYTSNLFNWNADSTGTMTLGVAGRDVAGNTAATTLNLRVDNDPPTGGAINYQSGIVTGPSVTVTLDAIADSGSGLADRTRWLQRRTGTLNGNTCTMTAWDDAYRANPAATSTEPVAPGTCYQFRYAFTDGVGNQQTTTGPLLARRSYAAVVRATGGLAHYYRLDDTTATITDSTAGNNGTFTNGPVRGQAGAITGQDSGTSVFFDGTNDYGRVSRTISGDFSIELWLRSTQNPGGTGTQWWNGVGLVDGEVAGATNDFGISLLSGGRIAAGTGNPDRTAVSPTGYNDDAWHHVVMTRSGGTVRLYIDGTQVANYTNGNTAALTAPANIDLGRLQTGSNYFRGYLDEIAIYTTALSAATVNSHYQAAGP